MGSSGTFLVSQNFYSLFIVLYPYFSVLVVSRNCTLIAQYWLAKITKAITDLLVTLLV